MLYMDFRDFGELSELEIYELYEEGIISRLERDELLNNLEEV